MEYHVYYEAAQKASELLDGGDIQGALDALHALVSSDISDLDKALMSRNIAVVCQRLNDVENALAWYDAGISYEQPYMRHGVLEQKAAYLAELGREAESIALYEHLLAQPAIMENERDRVMHNLNTLRGRQASA